MDPALVDRWSADGIGSMMVHQVGHLLRDHAGRAQQLGIDEYSQDDWVAAADAEINDDLLEDELNFPEDPILPSAIGCEPGGFAEDYFRTIRGKQVCAGECGSGADAQPREWEKDADGAPEITPAAAELLRCKVAADIRACAGNLPGSVPEGWQRWADELLEPRVSWQQALAGALRTGVESVAGCVDYSYMRVSRRAGVTRDVILPALRRPLPGVAVVVDTSASMSDGLLGGIVPEVEAILRGVGRGRSRMHVLACDTHVREVQRVSSARQVQLFGGGGTDMGAGIDSALALRPPPSVIVVLTDGYTPWPEEGPRGARVVVGLVGAGDWPVPDWATAVRIEDAP
jgi:predicted metal-dependent peptidase